MNPTVICLMGPTASGKTETALYLADHFAHHIISVDSALIYKGMDIGTAKPDTATLKKYPHALVDICSPLERYSAAEFRLDAREEIKWAFENNKTPILVGGTFLYFKALLEGISPIPEADPKIKTLLNNRLKIEGLAPLYKELMQVDEAMANRLSPNDTQRILRALEVFLSTGKTLSYYWTLPKVEALSYPYLKLSLLSTNIEFRNAQIEKRFSLMIKAGFVDEVAALKKNFPELNGDYPSQRAVGYRQIWEYLEGKQTLPDAIERAVIATRQYAKRQRTWLRSESDLTPINIDAPNFKAAALSVVEKFLNQA